MAPGTLELLARIALGEVRSEDYVSWACRSLEEGQDSRHLRMLAGMTADASLFEVEELFGRVARELGLSLPSPERAVLDLAVHIARAMLGGEYDLRQGVRELARLCAASEYRYDVLMPFHDLDETLDEMDMDSGYLLHPDLRERPWPEVARDEAGLLLRFVEAGLLDGFRHQVACSACPHIGSPRSRDLEGLWKNLRDRLRRRPRTVAWVCQRCGSDQVVSLDRIAGRRRLLDSRSSAP
ncbi:MAG: hypothetical protein ABIJ09_15620 [Pseudomonadota bacterium]